MNVDHDRPIPEWTRHRLFLDNLQVMRITITTERRDRVDYDTRLATRTSPCEERVKAFTRARSLVAAWNSQNRHIMTQIELARRTIACCHDRRLTDCASWPFRWRRWSAPFFCWEPGLPWLKVVTPHWVVIRAGIIFLWFLLGAFILAVPAAAIGVIWSWTWLFSWPDGDAIDPLSCDMKWAVLSSSCFASLIMMEAVVRFMDQQSYRIPDPRSRDRTAPAHRETRSAFEQTGRGERLGPLGAIGSGEGHRSVGSDTKPLDGTGINILVLGESSAAGEPYDPWVSVGQIVGWKLESVFPGRAINVDVRARGGFCLEQALLALAQLEYTPDAIVLFWGTTSFTLGTAGLATSPTMPRRDRRASWAYRKSRVRFHSRHG